MVYNIADLVAYARSRDERLANVAVYPTPVIEKMVEESFAVAQDMRAIFAATETYDLYDSVVTDELTEMEIVLTKEPHSVRKIIDYDTLVFAVEVTSNNHILIKVKKDAPEPTSYKITIKYFYYPLLPLTTIELSIDAYRLIKEAIGIVVCAELRDYEQEAYHRNKAKLMAQESAYDLEKGVLEFPETLMDDGTWV